MTSEARELTVVAVFQARPGKDVALGEALMAMLEPTRAEAGCVRYDLHRARASEGQWFFDEIWSSAADHAAHVARPHVQALLARAGDLYESPIVEYRGDRVEPSRTTR
jgi:quinol monooxygenase YgiN